MFRLIEKLSALPDIRNSSAIKYVYAEPDKKGYDIQHINLLLKTVQELRILLNQNESEKVQKTINQVLTLIKTN